MKLFPHLEDPLECFFWEKQYEILSGTIKMQKDSIWEKMSKADFQSVNEKINGLFLPSPCSTILSKEKQHSGHILKKL